jgi:hypothetical protein
MVIQRKCETFGSKTLITRPELVEIQELANIGLNMKAKMV